MKPQTLPFQKLRLCRIHRWTPPRTHPSTAKKTPTGNSQHNAFEFSLSRKRTKFWANKRQIPWHLQYPTSPVCPNPLISWGSPWHQIGALQSVIVPRISTDMCVSAWSWCDLSLWVVLVQGRKPTRTPNNVTPERNIKHKPHGISWKNSYAYLGLPYKETHVMIPLEGLCLGPCAFHLSATPRLAPLTQCQVGVQR